MKGNYDFKVDRKRQGNGKSVWGVEFGIDLISKIARRRFNKNKLTYNTSENFEVDMGVKDGKAGYVKSLTTGKEVAYKVTVIEDEEKYTVRFDFGDNRMFKYDFAKTFRGFLTGAFYKFFWDLLRKTDELATVRFDESPAT